MTNTKENTVIPPCCQSCIAEGSIDEARLAMAYENGRDETRREFKEYLEKKAEEDDRFTRIGNAIRRELVNEIINELFKGG